MGDKIKAVFLGATDKGRAKLATKVAGRTKTAQDDIAAARQSAGRMPDEHVAKAGLLKDAATLEQKVQAAQPPGVAADRGYVALGGVCKETLALRERAEAAVTTGVSNDAKGRRALIEMNIASTKRAALLVDNEAKAKEVLQPLAAIEHDYDGIKDAGLMPQLDAVLNRAVTAREAAEQAIGTPAEAGSPREKSRQRLSDMAAIPGLDGILDPTRRDARGRRNAAEESAARLNVFDTYLAAPEDDPLARRTNKAMRTAAVIKSMAQQQARTQNDPALEGKIGSVMVAEYGPDLDQSTRGKKLTQALVMDDPVLKLLTGKIRFEDAVGRVRDQAAIAGVKPSKMLDLLMQQVEMNLGSKDQRTDLEAGTLENDGSEKFVLSDLEGELSPDQSKAILREGGPKMGGAGLVFGEGAVTQLSALREETLKWDVAETKEKVRERKPWINTKAKPEQKAVITPEMLAAKAAELTNPAERTQITGYQYDDKTEKRVLDAKGNLATATKTVEAAPYLTAPGLGQSHQVDGPLDNALETGTAAEKAAAEKDALYGALDGKQYAHLRMLQRADAEERETPVTYKYDSAEGTKEVTGKPQHIVYEYFKRVYKMDEGKTDALLSRVAAAFNSVPLTVTFKASSLFSAAKDAPAHGTTYVSDVKYTRGKADTKSLAGRDDNTKIEPTKLAAVESMLQTKQEQLITVADQLDDLLKADDASDNPDAADKLFSEQEKLEADIEELLEQLQTMTGESLQLGVVGGDRGAWVQDRGANYQRWRRDKDSREGRLDEAMGAEQAQVYGAVNPSFAGTQGTGKDYVRGAAKASDTEARTDDTLGTNYYGDAHFKLKDGVRKRVAFAVRGNGVSLGGGKSAVQRTDLLLMLSDMIRGGGSNLSYIDSIAALAIGSATSLATGTDWEIHLYGGFDPTKDASEIYLSPKVEEPYRTRINNFANSSGLTVVNIQPLGATVSVNGSPVRQEVAAAAATMEQDDAA